MKFRIDLLMYTNDSFFDLALFICHMITFSDVIISDRSILLINKSLKTLKTVL